MLPAELLTPRHALLPALPQRPNLSNLAMVKTQWGVSIKALVRRCRELGVIDADRALSLYQQVSKKGWNRTEPGFVPMEKPRGLRKLAELCYGAAPTSNEWPPKQAGPKSWPPRSCSSTQLPTS
jgi:Zn-dependent peptidase ImmA (M78 family)